MNLEKTDEILQEQYGLIIENTNDLIAIYNENFEHEFINEQAYFNVLGYSKKEILGKRPRYFVHPDDIKKVAKIIKKGLEKGEIFGEYRIRHKDGHYIWLETKGKFFNYKNGSLRAIFISRDITERKEAEKKLRESEEKFRKIFESIPDLFLLTTDDSTIIDYSGKEKDFYIPPKKFLGKKLTDIMPLELGKLTLEKIKTLTKTKEPQILEYSLPMKGKEEFYEARFLYFSKKQVAIFIRNMTSKKTVEQELIKLNNLKSELLRRTSHELKTPLVSIKGFSDLLLQLYRDKLDKRVISIVNEIKDGCNRLESLISDILKAAKLESDVIQVRKSKNDLASLIKFCIKEIQGFAKARNHTIELKLSDPLITRFEKEQMHQVVSNLLNNAIKFTPINGIINISSEIKDYYIIISIKDNGIGFTEQEKNLLFKQFGKIERYGKGWDLNVEGSGLGLYITKKIIELHGGQIWVESKGRNQGSTFSFSLPIIDD